MTTVILWLLTLATFPIWIHQVIAGWDAAIYSSAVDSVRAHHDPYADAIAIQDRVHGQAPSTPSLSGPYSYVYSPITLPIVRLAGSLPLWLDAILFWLCYVAGVLAQLWVGVQIASPAERPIFAAIAPVAVFFPGFLASDNIISGNVAYMLYGAVLLSAFRALKSSGKRGPWLWFYLAVLAASCFKAPLLSLLAIPVLSARRQWLPAAATAAAGVALFAIQPLLWPTLFHNYLEAVALQFTYNRDFGFSPAGILGGLLYDRHVPYSTACSAFYLLYAAAIFVTLFLLSRRFVKGAITLAQWAPVLLIGVILLNPRIMEYDAAPLALPLAFVLWRFFAARFAPLNAALCSFAVFLAANLIAGRNWQVWKLTDALLLLVFWTAGAIQLFAENNSGIPRNSFETPVSEAN